MNIAASARPDARVVLGLAWAAFLVVAVIGGGWSPWALGAVALLLAAVPVFLWRRGSDPLLVALAAWPPLHLVLMMTGGTASALTPLAAAWAVATGRVLPRRLAWAPAAGAALLVPAVHAVNGAMPGAMDFARFVLLMAVAAAAALLLSRDKRDTGTDEGDAPQEDEARPATDDTTDAVATARMLELARRATDAHEATLWRMDADGRTARRLGWAAPPGAPEPPFTVEMEGHPFGWAIVEQVHVHLQRGKRDLPSPWAAEMLLVPVNTPRGVLALAYPGVAPPGVEPVALEAGEGLGTLFSLLAMRRDAARAEAATEALLEAVRTLPGALEIDAFARHLADATRRGVGAAGVAIVQGPGDSTPGRILHVSTAEGREPQLPPVVGEADSRVALAIKHGVELSYADLRRERDRLPVFGPREQWDPAPRSVALLPLAADGRTLGAVVAWHPLPDRFGEREMELLRRICSVAPIPLRSATQYEALDRRASTDALTGLPNRATFESRLATAAAYFDRYARPFSIAIMDVDFFKKFNDTWGHEAGDRVLQHVAEVLRTTVRDSDLPARLGGEEFVVLMPETGVRAAAEAAERLRRALEARAVIWNGRPLSVTASFGVAGCPECVATPAEVLAAADAALYRAKGTGRNRVNTAPRVGTPAEPDPAPRR